MKGVLPAELAEFFKLKLISGLLLVLIRTVIFTLALGTIETNGYPHKSLQNLFTTNSYKPNGRRKKDFLSPP